MDPAEALEDAIQTLTLQGVDLSGIVTCVPGESSVNNNPVIQTIERLKQLDLESASTLNNDDVLNEIVELLDRLNDLCADEASGNVAIATKNGGVQSVCSVFLKLPERCNLGLISSLKTLATLLHDLQSTETFRESGGAKAVVGILKDKSEDVNILDSGFSVVAAAATGNEVLKESFMDLKIDELIVQCLRENTSGSIPCLYDAIQILLTSDDNRVVASQVFGYARRFAKIGIVEALVGSIHQGIRSPSIMAACNALKCIAVNEEICRAVANNGGIDGILSCIDDSGQQGNQTIAKMCCSLLSKVSMMHPMAVTNCNIDMESLIYDQNRSIATLAITTLVKTGNESSVDRLMKQITNFMSDIADEFKIVVVEAIRSLCLKFPLKYRSLFVCSF